MKIIDTHCHIYPDSIADKAVVNIGKFYNLYMNCNGKTSSLLDYSNKYSVEKIVVCSVATSATQVSHINDYMAEQLKIDKFLPIATLHPDMDKESIKEEVKRFKQLGLKGLKLHPDCQKFSLIEDRSYNLLESLEDFDLPILVHTGDKRFDYSHPKYMVQVAKDFPHLKFIAAHFGGWSEWEDAYLYRNVSNVMFDTSSSFSFLSKEKAKELIYELGPEKIMFGSDFPMWNYDIEVPKFLDLNLGDEINSMIFYENAKNLYKI